MLVPRLVHPWGWGFTLVAGVVHPGAVDRLSGLPYSVLQTYRQIGRE